ncbi:MAG: hypothetical protein HQK76_05520 [Desulfobacterales bacterium]|nr:hypothetical protein [Desulfobacterales bacterium]
MKEYSKYNFFSGGLKGAETEFGSNAEKWGINETHFSFVGHQVTRERNVKILSNEELKLGDISMEIVSTRMGRRYSQADKIRKVFQVIFHMVNKGFQVFAVGKIMEDSTVKGGTGWGVELAKFFNRPLSVFDQETNKWYTWKELKWEEDTPVIHYETFCGTGTRNLTEEGKKAIQDLFERSFGK